MDLDKVNPNGGAIALGHPVGASGAILTVKLMYEMQRQRARYGLVVAVHRRRPGHRQRVRATVDVETACITKL